MDPQPDQPDPTDSDPTRVDVYRLAPALVARFVGAFLVVLAVVVFVGTALVAALRLPPDLLVVPLVLGVAGTFGLGWWLRRRAWVVRLDDVGYQVRLVRSARVREAAWEQVREVGTTTDRGVACVIVQLADGRCTVVPVAALEVDREQFVRDLQGWLRRTRGT